jgi:hypothetical protein
MITRAHAVALPTGQLLGLHETSLPELLYLVVGPVLFARGLLDNRIAQPNYAIDRQQWICHEVIGEQRDRIETAGVRQLRQRRS